MTYSRLREICHLVELYFIYNKNSVRVGESE